MANLQVLDGSGATVYLKATGTGAIGDPFILERAPSASENHIGSVGGGLVNVSAEFTRPANTTAYTAGDVVSDSTSATTLLAISGCARVSQGSGYITGIRVIADQKSITPRLRIHVYNASNPTVAVDNAAMKILYADIGKRIGSIDLIALTTATDTANSTSSQAQALDIRVPFVCAAASTTLYLLIETLDAFTPANAGKFTIQLMCDQN